MSVLGDDLSKTLHCADRVEDAIEDEFDVSASQDVDTSATSSSYSKDSDDEETIYIDYDIVDDEGCNRVIKKALNKVDHELAEYCEFSNRSRRSRSRSRR